MKRNVITCVMGVLPVFISYLAMIYLLGPVLQAVCIRLMGSSRDSADIFYICHILINTLCLGLLYGYYRKKQHLLVDDDPGLKMNVKEGLSLAAIVIIWGHFSMIVSVLISTVLGAEDSAVNGAGDGSVAILPLLSVVVAAPLTEEFVFRKIIYGKLRVQISCIPALLLVSLLWAAAHGALLTGLNACLMSIVYTLIYERYRSIKWPVLAHSLSNFISLLTSIPFVGHKYGAFMEYIVSHSWLTLLLGAELGIVVLLCKQFPDRKSTIEVEKQIPKWE